MVVFFVFLNIDLLMKQFKFLLLSFLGIFAGLYVIYVSYFYFNQEEMVFVQYKLDENYKFNFENNFEEVKLKSFDGKYQHGILFKANGPKGLVFYLHGNAGAVDSWGRISKTYTDLGYDIFILDYRSFGKSEGEIENEEQILKDVQIVFDSVSKKYKKNIIIGYSIGTGVASCLASIRKNDILILKAPFDNFLKFTEGRVPYFPNSLKKFRFETDKNLSKITTPIYLFHGNKDQLISVENSFRLKQVLKSTDSLFILEGQKHLGINENVEYKQKITELLK